MTNADCIRRMSDEQLYEFLSEWECVSVPVAILEANEKEYDDDQDI